MRHVLHSPGKGLLRSGLMLILAMSMWFVFGDVAQAQNDQQSCEASSLEAKFPTWLNQGFEKHYIDAVAADQHDEEIVDAEVSGVLGGEINPSTGQAYLQCGESTLDLFPAPPIEYKLVRTGGSYSKVTFTFRHSTTFVGCNSYTKKHFTDNPEMDEDYVGAYQMPGAYIGENPLVRVLPTGALSIDNQPGDWKIGQSSSVAVDQVFSHLSSGLQQQGQVTGNLSSWYQLKTFSLDGGKLVAISYRELDVSVSAIGVNGGPVALQDANKIANASLIFGIGEILGDVVNMGKAQSLFYSAALNTLAGVNNNIDLALSSGELVALILDNTPLASVFSFTSWARVILPASYGAVTTAFTSSGLQSSYAVGTLDVTAQVETALKSRYQHEPGGTVYRRVGVTWHPSIGGLLISGDKFQPQSTFNFRFGIPGQPLVHEWHYTSDPSLGETIYMGVTFGNLNTGCYLLSVVAPGTHGGLQVAGNFVWIESGEFYNPQHASQTVYPPSDGSGSPSSRTCSNPVDLLTEYVNIFSESNCGGTITWWSAHPPDGPSANGASMYVPENSIVNVRDGSGATACFDETQVYLGEWANRIQWAQHVPGGSCPTVPAEEHKVELFHKQNHDHRFHTIEAGQTWHNDTNKIVESIVVKGTTRAIFKHRSSGFEECWDYSNRDLYGDWHLQTKWVRVEKGRCPQNADILATFYEEEDYDKVDGWLDVKAFGYFHMDPLNDNSNSMRLHYSNMSVLLCKHANLGEPCYCRTSSDHYFRNNRFSDNSVVEDHLSSGFLFDNDSCEGQAFVPHLLPDVPAAGAFATGSTVEYSYYETELRYAPVPSGIATTQIGAVGNFDLSQVPHREEQFSVSFRSCLQVPTTGNYTFYTVSDDGSELYINGFKVVNNDAAQVRTQKSGMLQLNAGTYPIQVEYWQGSGEGALGVSWQGPGIAKEWIPNSALTTGCSFDYDLENFSNYTHMFSDKKGGVYAIRDTGIIVYYRHEVIGNTHLFDGPYYLGDGWTIYSRVFADGRGGIYAMNPEGKLVFYQHSFTNDNVSTWIAPYQVGQGWTIFSVATPDFNGGIYTMQSSGAMTFYRHTFQTNTWQGPITIGQGWNMYNKIFTNGLSGIYGRDVNGKLFYYRNTISGNGAVTWQDTYQVGQGWNIYDMIFSDGTGGVFGRDASGKLYYYFPNTQTNIGLQSVGRNLINSNLGISPAAAGEPEIFTIPVLVVEPTDADAQQIFLPLIRN